MTTLQSIAVISMLAGIWVRGHITHEITQRRLGRKLLWVVGTIGMLEGVEAALILSGILIVLIDVVRLIIKGD